MSLFASGYAKHVVVKYDDFNAIYKGTISQDVANKPYIELKSLTSGAICGGSPQITERNLFNYIIPSANCTLGKAYLSCNDGRNLYVNWSVRNFYLNEVSGVGNDIYGQKLSFYLGKNDKNADVVFEKYKNEQMAKPQLTKPKQGIDTSKINNSKQALNTSDLGLYVRKVERTIKSNWHPPYSNKNRKVEFLFKIAKNGELLNYSILLPSGSTEWDNAALDALKSSLPLPPLPREYLKDSLEIKFAFACTL